MLTTNANYDKGERMVTRADEPTKEHDDRWAAVVTRDTSRDGSFVYAVTTTGIYCKPSCPSRKPQRKNVAIFSLAELAEGAGFRPCLRCQPNDHPSDDSRLALVRHVCQAIRRQHADVPTLEALAQQVHVSPYHLQKLFTKVVGISPRQYADAHRLGTLKQTLLAGGTVADGLYEAGYSSPSRLYENSPGQLGMTPATYRKHGLGMQVRYALAECPLGKVLVAATDKGICAVSLGNDESSLIDGLRREFQAAQVSLGSDHALTEWLDAVLDRLTGKGPNVHLPLDVQATAFQRMVWEELQRIPAGETATYGEVARKLGRPSAARAVARACATNPAAVVIPCHRVVRGDGGLGGYRWGLERKEALLKSEKADQVRP